MLISDTQPFNQTTFNYSLSLSWGADLGGTKSGGKICRFKKSKKNKKKQKKTKKTKKTKKQIQNQKVFPSTRASTVICVFLLVSQRWERGGAGRTIFHIVLDCCRSFHIFVLCWRSFSTITNNLR